MCQVQTLPIPPYAPSAPTVEEVSGSQESSAHNANSGLRAPNFLGASGYGFKDWSKGSLEVSEARHFAVLTGPAKSHSPKL